MATRMQWIVRDERGSILVSGLMLVFIMTLIGSGIFTAAVIENRLALGDTARTQGFYIAEAGLNTALRELADGDGTNEFAQVFNGVFNGLCPSPKLFCNKAFGTGSFTVTAQAVTGSSPKQITVTSTSCLPAATGQNPCPSANTQTTIQAGLIFQETLAGPFFALNTINVGLVDSFDSNLGAYSSTNRCQKTTAPFDCGADLRANGAGESPSTSTVTVSTLYGNIIDSQGQVSIGTVYGTVTYDPVLGSCPNCNATNVKGSIIQATTASVVIQPLQPCGPPYSTLTFVQSRITPPNQYSYNATTGAFSMNNNTVNFSTSGGVFCFGSIDVKGALNLPSGLTSPVVINVTGTISFSANGAINNNTFKAANLQILSSLNDISHTGANFGGHAGGYMYVFAPRTKIGLSGTSDLYGAMLGYDLTTTGGAQLHFDKALGSDGNLQAGIPTYTWNSGSWKACKNPSCT